MLSFIWVERLAHVTRFEKIMLVQILCCQRRNISYFAETTILYPTEESFNPPVFRRVVDWLELHDLVVLTEKQCLHRVGSWNPKSVIPVV